MPSTFPNFHLLKTMLVLFFVAMLTQGFFCAQKQDPPSLPTVIFSNIQLKISDPALGLPGVFLSWDYPVEAEASYFEIYQSMNIDSLNRSIHLQPASDSMSVVLPLPDSTRPFTLFFAARAIYVEPTGQKLRSDTLHIDSITIAPSLEIINPGAATYQAGRTLYMSVVSRSENGATLRIAYYEKSGLTWSVKQDTCLPINACDFPIFGTVQKDDSLVLEKHPVNDTTQALFCVIGTESFQEQLTGLKQSLSCKRYFRVGL